MTVQDQPTHPARKALQLGMQGTNGSLTLEQVAVVACLFPKPLRHSDPGPWTSQVWWGHREKALIYPASVMKLFALAGLVAFRTEGRLTKDQEDDRAAAAMIRISSNEATAYLMGRLTGAEDGSCLDPAALDDWCRRRGALQDWYLRQGRAEFDGLQLLHATYQDSPYGRAFQIRRDGNANRLSAIAGAALLYDIARGAVPGDDWMMSLMQRDFQRLPGYSDSEGDQVRGFLAEGLPVSTQVWSKAGHTSTTRHDLVYGENPDGTAFILSIMTEGEWTSRHSTFLPAFAREFHAHAYQSLPVAPPVHPN